MRGMTCVITGATAGIGLVAAERLGAMGARLLLVGRDRGKAAAVLRQLRERVPGLEASLFYADLAQLSEVRRLAGELLDAAPRLDVLVNNAGAIFRRRTVTGDGLERTFALNHMAYYLLTRLLAERLVGSAPARVVNVASEAHRGAALDFDDLQGERRYDGWTAYRRSKLANILFTRELARRLDGTGVTANCLHPGFVATSFGDNNRGVFRLALGLGKRFVAISPERGAETTVYLASSAEIATESGGYFEKCRKTSPSAAAQDDRAARRLWAASAQIAGLSDEGLR
jgi:NAD(P)-dependent dehydrogenase (short-subunit alcohol dehydrogenase family)